MDIYYDEETRVGGAYWGAKLPESFGTYATSPADVAPKVDVPVIDPH